MRVLTNLVVAALFLLGLSNFVVAGSFEERKSVGNNFFSENITIAQFNLIKIGRRPGSLAEKNLTILAFLGAGLFPVQLPGFDKWPFWKKGF